MPKKVEPKSSSGFINPMDKYGGFSVNNEDDDGIPAARAPIGKTKEEALETKDAIKARKKENAHPPSPKKPGFVNPMAKWGLNAEAAHNIETKAKKQQVSAAFVDPTKKNYGLSKGGIISYFTVWIASTNLARHLWWD